MKLVHLFSPSLIWNNMKAKTCTQWTHMDFPLGQGFGILFVCFVDNTPFEYGHQSVKKVRLLMSRGDCIFCHPNFLHNGAGTSLNQIMCSQFGAIRAHAYVLWNTAEVPDLSFVHLPGVSKP